MFYQNQVAAVKLTEQNIQDNTGVHVLNLNQHCKSLEKGSQKHKKNKKSKNQKDIYQANNWQGIKGQNQEDEQNQNNYKLPSYSSCLQAEIYPQNYQKLRDYFEVAIKDQKIADLNFKNMLKSSKQKHNINTKLESLYRSDKGYNNSTSSRQNQIYYFSSNINDKYRQLLQDQKLKQLMDQQQLRRSIQLHQKNLLQMRSYNDQQHVDGSISPIKAVNPEYLNIDTNERIQQI
ncbi:UNKNOWN [Stylonychia lemnae]|uniref:Uncharacterized protein n=1 Tax=Stylonychia lemnae TaxID=5949 RepID=A0A078AZW6_STYLE|nr:UNKNOWN [Stylonychia lemnae]|eukprot:CDW86727.1 UNKNOWN [Stylonychia lemnae]